MWHGTSWWRDHGVKKLISKSGDTATAAWRQWMASRHCPPLFCDAGVVRACSICLGLRNSAWRQLLANVTIISSLTRTNMAGRSAASIFPATWRVAVVVTVPSQNRQRLSTIVGVTGTTAGGQRRSALAAGDRRIRQHRVICSTQKHLCNNRHLARQRDNATYGRAGAVAA